MCEKHDRAVVAFIDAETAIVEAYMSMQLLGAAKFSSERRKLKDIIGDLRIARRMIDADREDVF